MLAFKYIYIKRFSFIDSLFLIKSMKKKEEDLYIYTKKKIKSDKSLFFSYKVNRIYWMKSKQSSQSLSNIIYK